MTLILKSSNIATGNVGSVHGDISAMDFRGMLDFSRGEYYTVTGGVRQDYGIGAAITDSRTSAAPYYDADGVLRSAAPNVPRIHSTQGTAGLLLTPARTNLLTSGADGTVLVFGAFSDPVILSFMGSGDATLNSANLTLSDTFRSSGRTTKVYARSVSTAFNATLSTTGSVSEVQAERAPGALSSTPFMGYNTAIAIDTVSLSAPFTSLFAGGKGTIVVRSVYLPSGVNDSRAYEPIGLRSASALGGLYHRVSASKSSIGTDNVYTANDGSALNGGTSRAQVTGNWRDSHVNGLAFSGYGDSAGVISRGQYAKATGLGAQFGEITSAYIGGEPAHWSTGAGTRTCGIITHCIIYDRMLSDAEAQTAANQWL